MSRLSDAVAHATGLPPTKARAVLDSLAAIISSTLAQGATAVHTDLGAFHVVSRKARRVTTPRGIVDVPERRVVKFSPSSALKARVARLP